ncbi:hypothetical protein H8E77_14365 [bacterium]|nr:hypothetical protein [bacterium]
MLSAPLDAGRSQTFSADYDTVVKAARDALMSSGLAIDDASEVGNKTFVILAKKGTSAWSWGELVRVTVQEVSESKTTVRVYTKRKLATNVTAKGDWADTVFSNITLQLR